MAIGYSRGGGMAVDYAAVASAVGVFWDRADRLIASVAGPA